jgi:hypothetical protein
MRYEVYRHKESSDEDFQSIYQAYRLIVSENEAIYNSAQGNLDSRTSADGEVQPRNADSPLYFQTIVRDLVESHQKREATSHEQIWPARQRLPQDAAVSKEDVDFCSKLTPEGGGCCGGKACGGGPAPGPATAPEIMVS